MLTEETVTATILELLDEFGWDYVYPENRCTYADADGNPSCFVGHIIYRLDPEAFDKIRSVEADQGSMDVCDLNERGYIDIDWRLANAVNSLQSEQDNKKTWGNAYQAYLWALEPVED